MSTLPDVHVVCSEAPSGWVCTVRVCEGGNTTTHEVRVTNADRERLACGRDVERLVRDSFSFLLEREPKEAILHSFNLAEIQHYFPEYEETLTGAA